MDESADTCSTLEGTDRVRGRGGEGETRGGTGRKIGYKWEGGKKRTFLRALLEGRRDPKGAGGGGKGREWGGPSPVHPSR